MLGGVVTSETMLFAGKLTMGATFMTPYGGLYAFLRNEPTVFEMGIVFIYQDNKRLC